MEEGGKMLDVLQDSLSFLSPQKLDHIFQSLSEPALVIWLKLVHGM